MVEPPLLIMEGRWVCQALPQLPKFRLALTFTEIQLEIVPPASTLEKVPTINVQGEPGNQEGQGTSSEEKCSNML